MVTVLRLVLLAVADGSLLARLDIEVGDTSMSVGALQPLPPQEEALGPGFRSW